MNHIYRDAVLSPCGKFRYRLDRKWALGGQVRKRINFVMLNPSTADSNIDDATVRKCVGFADRNGFNELRIVNLFAYRATKPRDLVVAGYPVGPDNHMFLSDLGVRSAATKEPVVLAWGANARGLVRPDVVIEMMRSRGASLFTLHRLAHGTPAHPLMLPYSCRLTPF